MILANEVPQYPLSHSVLSRIVFSSDTVSHQPRITMISALGAILVAAGAAIRLRAYEGMGDMFTFRRHHQEGQPVD